MNNSPVRKAVIPAAGLGTRSLPASKSVPKELTAIVDRPVIQYVVEEIVRSGITSVCLVVSDGKEAVADHFAPNPKLEAALEHSGKTELLETVRRLSDLAEIHTVVQEEPLGLGHAVLIAKDYVGSDPFVVALPDEMFDPQENVLGEMAKIFQQEERSVVAVNLVPHDQIRLYGAIGYEEKSGNVLEVSSVVEKPDPDEAPSDFAVIGRYVLSPSVFDVLETIEWGAGGELQLADALGYMGQKGDLVAFNYGGRRWDVGTRLGYLEAVLELGLRDPAAGEAFTEMIKRRISVPR